MEAFGKVIWEGMEAIIKLTIPLIKPSHDITKIFQRTRTFVHDPKSNTDHFPNLKRIEKTPQGTNITMTLPAGMTPGQIEGLHDELAYHFNCHPVFTQHGKEITVYLNSSAIPSMVPYTPQNLTGVIPFYIGETVTGETILDLPRLPQIPNN